MTERYDLAVIGSGPGGYRAAVLGALRGLEVVIIERAQWGGCCLNRGCVPKKDWYHSARLISAQRHFAGRGIQGQLVGDLGAAWTHQHEVVATVRSSYLDYLKHLKVQRRTGTARFLDPETLCIDSPEGSSTTLAARQVIVATGAEATVPEPFALSPGKVLSTDMLFAEPPPPGHRVAVIGSGVVATEMAFILQQLGRDVTWLTRSRPLARLGFSAQAHSVLMTQLADHGVVPQAIDAYREVRVGADGVEIRCAPDARFVVDWVLLGTGRTPFTAGLDLERAGIACDSRGFIQRDAQLRTAAPQVYAIGDVAGDWMTANHALSDATIAVANILGEARTQDGNHVPMVVYSAVEMARTGLDDDAAEDAGFEPAVGFAAFETSPRALGQDEPEGFVRLLGDMDTGALLGGEIIGAEAGELIHLLVLAPDRATALRWLARGTWNHPARAEEVLNATETLAAKWHLQSKIFV